MAKIIDEANKWVKPYEYKEEGTTENAISEHVGQVADQTGSSLIIAFTHSGVTARRISRHRHRQPIVVASMSPETIRRLCFSWGVYPHLIRATRGFDDMLIQARELAQKNAVKSLVKGQKYLISAGMPFGESGSTNMILVQTV